MSSYLPLPGQKAPRTSRLRRPSGSLQGPLSREAGKSAKKFNYTIQKADQK